jgi:hypothetical protein
MIDDMMLRNLSPANQHSYLHAVRKFSRHFAGRWLFNRSARYWAPEPRSCWAAGRLGGWVVMAVDASGPVILMGITFNAWQLTFLIVGAPRNQVVAQGARDVPGVLEVLRTLRRERAIFVPHIA